MVDVQVGDRRPIASRKLRIWQLAAGMLARWDVSANGISVAGMVSGIAGGVALLGTRMVATSEEARLLFVAAAACIQLRLLANMLDGMVAVESGTVSVVGELFNEIPDRVSDTAILAGAGYALGGDPALGWAAAFVAMFVTYIRAVGKGMGVPGLFQGPMSKSHRMFTLTMTCLYLAVVPAWMGGAGRPLWQLSWPAFPLGVISAALALIVAGGLVTAWRRLARIVRALRERA